MPRVCVALPLNSAPEALESACAAILAQTLADLELLLILNGADEQTTRRALAIAHSDRRVRIESLPDASLPAALNKALRSTACEFVARMDADDWCPAHRLAIQLDAMESRPDIAALGCAWELEETSGTGAGSVSAVIRPPRDPREARWRLLLANTFPHGGMLLRRTAVLEAGAYDESLARAQDYDLWIRLSQRLSIGAVPDVLYRHRRRAGVTYSASPQQASLAAGVMLRAWQSLPSNPSPTAAQSLTRSLAGVLYTQPEEPDPLHTIESSLASAPSREALMAWLWASSHRPAPLHRALESCRRARVRELASLLRASSVASVYLYGAGAHSVWLAPAFEACSIRVRALLDDHPGAPKLTALPVLPPSEVVAGDHVVLSSDAHEDALWKASEPLRRRGVHVHRFYDDAHAA